MGMSRFGLTNFHIYPGLSTGMEICFVFEPVALSSVMLNKAKTAAMFHRGVGGRAGCFKIHLFCIFLPCPSPFYVLFLSRPGAYHKGASPWQGRVLPWRYHF